MTLRFKKTLSIITLTLLLALFVASFLMVDSNIAYAENKTTTVTGDYIYAENPIKIYDEDAVVENSPIPVYGSAVDALKDKPELVLFYLPYTYYLKVIDDDIGDMVIKVQYMDLTDLYILISDLTFLDEEGNETKWVSKECTFSDESIPFPSTSQTKLTLKETITGVELNGLTYDNTFSFNYIGSDNNNNFYVKITKDADVTYGKTSKDNFKEFNLTTNFEAVDVYVPPIVPVLPPTSNPLRIIIIVGIAIPAVIIMFVIFMPRKKEQVNEYEFMKSKKQDDFDYDRDRTKDESIK